MRGTRTSLDLDLVGQTLLDTVRAIQADSHNHRSLALYERCLAAIQLAAQNGDDAAYVLIAQAFGLVMDQKGYPDDAIATLVEASQRAQNGLWFGEQAHLLYLVGRAFYTRAIYQEALVHWTEALDVAERAEDKISWGWAKLGIGQVCDALDAPALAVEVFADLRSTIDVLTAQVSVSANAHGRYEERLAELRIYNHLNLGVNHLRLGQEEAALDNFRKVCTLAQALGRRDVYCEGLLRLAEVAHCRKQISQALGFLDEAFPIATECAHFWALANLHLLRAQCHDELGNTSAALLELDAASQCAASTNARHLEMRAAYQRAAVCEKSGDASSALAALKEAMALQASIDSRSKSETLVSLEDLADLRISADRKLLLLANDGQLETGDWESIAPMLCEQGCTILGVDRVVYWDIYGDGLQSAYCWPENSGPPEVIRCTEAARFIERLVGGHIVMAHNAMFHQDTWELAKTYLQPLGIEALAACPVQVNGTTVGAFSFEQIGHRRPWPRDAASLVNQLSLIAARSLSNLQRDADQKRIGELNAALQQNNQALESRVEARGRELQRAMGQLVQSEKLASLGSLVAGVAHELNTPIGNALLTMSTLTHHTQELRTKIESNTLRKSDLAHYLDDAEKIAGLAVHSLKRASELIVNFKQVAVDTSSDRRRTFDLADLIDTTLGAMGHRFRNRPIEVLQNVRSGIALDSFPGALEQVLSILIENSLFHAFSNQDTGVMELRCLQADADSVVLEYRDNGAGISKENQRKVFDPFFTTRLGQGGSGLGLYLAYALMTGPIGGQLTLESTPGAGVCFALTIPRTAPKRSSESESP